MASSTIFKLLCIGLMGSVLLAPPQGEAAVSCSSVYSSLYPCLGYVMGSAPLQQGCCNGVKSIYDAARTPSDRQSVCSCLKSLASSGGGNINFNNAQSLPKQCGVNLPYQITPTIDCSKVY
ncbi:hypothetical protein ACH5RR_025383 [Cinchona calisaya]|uniref:Non-specific lipid-transfer protein n=1 Tax=Cinchona calisaya TaxID=153742 RepID=A0ABD2Z1F8_9GENT